MLYPRYRYEFSWMLKNYVHLRFWTIKAEAKPSNNKTIVDCVLGQYYAYRQWLYISSLRMRWAIYLILRANIINIALNTQSVFVISIIIIKIKSYFVFAPRQLNCYKTMQQLKYIYRQRLNILVLQIRAMPKFGDPTRDWDGRHNMWCSGNQN